MVPWESAHINTNPRFISVVFRLNGEKLETLREQSRATQIR